MKNDFLEMLFDMFEKGLNQLKAFHEEQHQNDAVEVPVSHIISKEAAPKSNKGMRILDIVESLKISKASYQFLMRLQMMNIMGHSTFEKIVDALMFSESHIVSLQETKLTTRKILGEDLDFSQLAFLDLILFHKENAAAVH